MIYIIETSLCWLFFYLLYFFFLKKETFFQLNRWYLLVTLVISLLLPMLELPEHERIVETAEIAVVYLKPFSTTLQTIEVTATQARVAEEGFNFWTILQVGYGLGVCFLLGRFIIGVLKLTILYRQSKIEKYEEFTLVITSKKHLPFSFFNYLFWSEHHQLAEADRAKIIQHEKAHIQQRHSIDVIIVELLSIFLWCSPLIYFYKKSLRTVHEYLADAAVLKDNPIQTYGKLLLSQCMSGPSIVLANHFFQSPLKNRIIMMTKSKSPNQAMLKYLFAFPIFVSLLLVMSSKNLMAQAEKAAGEVFKVVEEMPRFPGCEVKAISGQELKECAQKEMLTFIYTNVKYPKAAQKAGIEGTVVTRFVIDKTGKITKPEITRSIGGGCDEEVLRVISMMPTWIPGQQKGKNVAVQFNLPVKFKMSSEKSSCETEEGVFKEVDQMPVFSGCEEIADYEERKTCGNKKLLEFIFGNIKYPEEARKLGVEGMVLSKFVVEKDGSISRIKITRSIGSGTDEEVLRVVNLMADLPGKWSPGVHEGKKVAVEFVLPIKFKLADPTEEEIKKEGLAPPREALTLSNYVVSPNPTAGQLNVQFEAEKAPLTFELIDMSGKALKNQNLKDFDGMFQETFDLSHVAKGTVIIKVSQNGKLYFNKVMVQ